MSDVALPIELDKRSKRVLRLNGLRASEALRIHQLKRHCRVSKRMTLSAVILLESSNLEKSVYGTSPRFPNGIGRLFIGWKFLETH